MSDPFPTRKVGKPRPGVKAAGRTTRGRRHLYLALAVLVAIMVACAALLRWSH